MPEIPKIVLPHGGYRKLIVYRKGETIYQATVLFCRRFLPKFGDRTVDQMTQAARSCKQNIAEGSASSGTSKETEIKLTNVARATLDELLEDYLDYLKSHGTCEWSARDKKKTAARDYAKEHADWEDWQKFFKTRDDVTCCNLMIVIIQQTKYLLDQMIKRQEEDFKKFGGVRERMHAARTAARGEDWNKGVYSRLDGASSVTELKSRLAEIIHRARESAATIAHRKGWSLLSLLFVQPFASIFSLSSFSSLLSLSSLLAALLLPPLSAMANTWTDPDTGIEWTYSIVSNAVIIGDVTNEMHSAISRDTTGAIVIPDIIDGLPVVDIAPYAFACCTNIVSVKIPDAVTNVSRGAFSFISSKGETQTGWKTETITNGSSVVQSVVPIYRSVEDWETHACENLTTVVLSRSLKKINPDVFASCYKLSTLEFRGPIEFIGEGAFAHCTRLTTLALPEGLIEIGYKEQAGWKTETTTTGGRTVSVVTPFYRVAPSKWGWGIFEGCSQLQTVNLPASLSSLSNYSFVNCVSLKAVNFAGDKPNVDGNELFVGTPWNMVVNVKGDTFGWYDPITYGRLAVWQHRRVAYDGVLPEEIEDTDNDAAREMLCSAIDVLNAYGSTFTDAEKLEWLRSIQSIVDRHPALLDCARSALDAVDESLDDVQKAAFAKWVLSVASSCLNPASDPTGKSAASTSAVEACLVVTNVVLHYVVKSIPSDMAAPISADTGIVNVMTEVKGGTMAIPDSWITNYPSFKSSYGEDFTAALMKPSGKLDAGGNAMFVWQDYVAGTDPTDENDVFAASMTMVGGKPVISYTPELGDAEKAKRKYVTWGKVKLQDENWVVVPSGSETDYNFFKVTVEMR